MSDTRIICDFSAEDDQGRELLKSLHQFPPWSVERAEMEAHLFMVLARSAWRQADRLRESQRRAERRKRK